jgi:ribosomal protein S18 acetylase RimI-like enzyme
MTAEYILNSLKENDLNNIVTAFSEIGWNKPRSIFENYLLEQSNGIRSILVAKENDKFCGYVTIKWESDYPFFRKNNIPEISDLNVLPQNQKKGLGSKLIESCQTMVLQRKHDLAGLGVGMTEDYGQAQRLYVRLGYMPDGYGLHYNNLPVKYGETIPVDDDLVLYLVKSLNAK